MQLDDRYAGCVREQSSKIQTIRRKCVDPEKET